MKRIAAFILALCLCVSLCACGENAKEKEAEKYIGTWYGYKLEAGDETLVFSEYESVVKLELTAEFDEDGTYTLHYYVNGKEGEQYPQTGTYTVEENQLVLDKGTAELVDEDLVISFDGGIKQYFTRS